MGDRRWEMAEGEAERAKSRQVLECARCHGAFDATPVATSAAINILCSPSQSESGAAQPHSTTLARLPKPTLASGAANYRQVLECARCRGAFDATPVATSAALNILCSPSQSESGAA